MHVFLNTQAHTYTLQQLSEQRECPSVLTAAQNGILVTLEYMAFSKIITSFLIDLPSIELLSA